MEDHTPTYNEALTLLKEFNQTDSLIKHAYAVEAAMRYFARTMGEDEEKWGIIGLLHDLDYERFPEQHCKKSPEILKERGWPDEYIRAVARMVFIVKEKDIRMKSVTCLNTASRFEAKIEMR